MYSEDLKELLHFNKNIASVWLDADGAWHTYEVEGCEEVARLAIIGAERIEEEPMTEEVADDLLGEVETPKKKK